LPDESLVIHSPVISTILPGLFQFHSQDVHIERPFFSLFAVILMFFIYFSWWSTVVWGLIYFAHILEKCFDDIGLLFIISLYVFYEMSLKLPCFSNCFIPTSARLSRPDNSLAVVNLWIRLISLAPSLKDLSKCKINHLL